MRFALFLLASAGAVALFSSPSSGTQALANPNSGASRISPDFQAPGQRMARRQAHHKHAGRGRRLKRDSKIGYKNKRACKQRDTSATEAATTTSAADGSSSTSAAPTTTSSSASAASSSTSSNGVSTKWGLAYADGPYNGVLQNHWTNGQISWYYNWRSIADDPTYYGDYDWITPAPSTFNYVPQLWGMDDERVAQFWNQSTYWGNQGVTHLMGFNEPDQAGQSNIPSGFDGAGHWKETLGKFKGQYTLVSPACTSAGMSWGWVGDFLSGGADPDVIAIHWYGINIEDFKNYTKGFHEAFGKPIWVTEIACTDFVNSQNCASVPNFLNEVAAFASQNDWLERISWYGAMDLTKSNGYGAVESDNGLCLNQDCASGRSDLGNQYFNGGWSS